MDKVPIARSDALPERGALRFQAALEGRPVPAFLIRVDGVARAYRNLCTHRQVELDLGDGTFFLPDGSLLRCRAHGALYEPRTGACAGGICKRGSALTPIPVVEEGGVIFAVGGGAQSV